MILLFTDFGAADLYVGQVKAVLARWSPGTVAIDLLHDAPAFDIRASAHLLCALAQRSEPGDLILAVVDPGVGTERRPIVMRADGRWFVGPDNGLLSVLAQRRRDVALWAIKWRPAAMSRSFHGRDLFAPVAARIAAGSLPADAVEPVAGLDVLLDAADLSEVIYVDHYGNAFTGLRASAPSTRATLAVNGLHLRHAEVFAQAEDDQPFWYVNSLGLIEIACNRGSAARRLGLAVGSRVSLAGEDAARAK